MPDDLLKPAAQTPHDFLLPDLGEGLTEAEIVSWLVKPGDVIAIDQIVVEVESAKSVVELPSPFGGRVVTLHAAAGEVVHKGSPLITVVPVGAELPTDDLTGRPADVAGSADASGLADVAADGPADAARATDAAESAYAAPLAVDRPLDSGMAAGSGAVLVGYGTSESTVRLKRPAGGRFGARVVTPVASAAMPAAMPAGVPASMLAGVPASMPAGAPAGLPAVSQSLLASATMLLDPSRRSPVVSPLVRKRAKSHGFDASQLIGSGPDSLVLRDDVEAAIAALAAQDAAISSTSGAEATGADASVAGAAETVAEDALSSAALVVPDAVPHLGTDDLRIPITGLRKLVAERLSRSRREIPEATIWLDVDATELFTAKERLQKSTGERFSLTALIARFVVAGLRQYPVLNSSLSADGQAIIQHGRINLGMAAQTPRGLMVPVVHNAQDMTTSQLRDAIVTLVTTSEKGDFPPGSLSGGTFTLNNYGGFGVDGSTPIINFPEVAMLGIGRVLERPWVVEGQLAVRRVMQLSFVFDHRVCDGDVASGFLTYVARCIEEPLLLLGNV
ncbi:2-oxo acid dehydrogenase subunit E2 [Leifsonia kafniensis]|uniref:Dihydrolipoamide acetyltransferase component of pyruvate dehydrogenase complex n=1 Tax=Leifsonia kafniensis TaxID=475957 RepID=A0ABP7L144_9MICO